MSGVSPIALKSPRTHAGDRRRLVTAGGVAGVVLVATALGASVVWRPELAVAIAAIPLFAVLLTSPHLRLAAIVFGAVAILDRSEGLDPGKLAYLVVLAVSVLAALASLGLDRERRPLPKTRSLALLAFAVVVGLIVFSAPIAAQNGSEASVWLRDVAPYLMLGAAPVLAADAARHVSVRFFEVCLLASGIIVLVGVSVQYASLRGITDTSAEGVVLTDLMLPIALVIYATARVITRGDRGERNESGLPAYIWGPVAVIGALSLLIAGSRTAVLVLPAVLLLAVILRRPAAFGRILGIAAGVVVMLLVALAYADSLGVNRSVVTERIETLPAVIDSPSGDPSFSDRSAQADDGWEKFRDSPIVGSGAGLIFQWYTPYGVARESFTIDASTATLAKFGIVGLVSILLFWGVMFRMMAVEGVTARNRAPIIGLSIFVIPYLVLSNPFEDKTLAIGILLLLGAALGATRETAEADPQRGTESHNST